MQFFFSIVRGERETYFESLKLHKKQPNNIEFKPNKKLCLNREIIFG